MVGGRDKLFQLHGLHTKLPFKVQFFSTSIYARAKAIVAHRQDTRRESISTPRTIESKIVFLAIAQVGDDQIGIGAVDELVALVVQLCIKSDSLRLVKKILGQQYPKATLVVLDTQILNRFANQLIEPAMVFAVEKIKEAPLPDAGGCQYRRTYALLVAKNQQGIARIHLAYALVKQGSCIGTCRVLAKRRVQGGQVG